MAECSKAILSLGNYEFVIHGNVNNETDFNNKPIQKQSVFTKVKVKYMLLHTSGETIELAGYGHGVDSQDKGAGKATTYALKNCLLYSFLTPVGKIEDTDTTHSEDIIVPTEKKSLTLQLAENSAKNKIPLSEMELIYTMNDDQKEKYNKLLNGASKS